LDLKRVTIMTPEDYAEAGVPVPQHMREYWESTGVYRWSRPEQGSYMCCECGDELGQCDCETDLEENSWP
jgi:hypothetical protein